MSAPLRLSTALRWSFHAAFATGVLAFIALIATPPTIVDLGAILRTAGIAAAASLVGLTCARTLERGRARPMMVAGLGATAVAALGWIGLAWIGGSLPGDLERLLIGAVTPFTFLAAVSLVVASLTRERLPSRPARAARAAAIACAVMAAAAAQGLVWLATEERLGRLLGAFVVLSLSATLLTHILARFPRLGAAPAEEEESVRMPVSLRCPRCGRPQRLTTGGDACGGCGLRIRVVVP